ncbi:MAG: hypothetical protein IT535_15795, partial [Bauldia sp.]|nr:hypothetical protein [Bauldia sp.]
MSIQESSLADGGLARLTASLRRSGRRWTGLAIVEAAALGIAVALAAFCGLQLAYAAFGRGASWLGLSGMPVPAWLAGWAPPPLGQHATLALGAGLLVFVAAALSAVIRRQGVPFFARLADRTFGMKERLSTALQLSGDAAGPLNPIERALLVDVEARSDAVDVRRLVPLRVPRAAMAALL